MSFCFDVETLGKESNSVILSASILYVNFEEEFTYEELIDRTVFVKFIGSEQIKAGRTTDDDTIDWWRALDRDIQETSLIPNVNVDVDVATGIAILREAYKEHNKELIWIRGSLDSVAIDSLANQFKQEVIAPWWNYRDVRTALDLLKETTKRAYCDIPGFDVTKVKKHDPRHDIAYDVFQLRYGV